MTVSGTSFAVNCKRWFMTGFNLWETVEAAAGALKLYGSTLPSGTVGPAFVRQAFDDAKSAGFNTVRVWAVPVSDAYALQSGPGEFNEAVLAGLDYVIEQARSRGLRVVLILLDNWQPGGVDTLVGWTGSTSHESFWTNADAQTYYKQLVEKIVTRTNTVNGRVYRDDPTIAAWNLVNEPRCYQCSSSVSAWISTMAAYVKSLDANHLVTVGEEGFFDSSSTWANSDPMGIGSWAQSEGQDFVSDHSDANVDYATIHLWPNNWHDTSSSFVSSWISSHAAASSQLGKPVVLEEYGYLRDGSGNSSTTSSRDSFFSSVLSQTLASAQSGGPYAGALFFQYYIEGQAAPSSEGYGDAGSYGIFDDDEAYAVSIANAQSFGGIAGGTVDGCAADGSPSASPAIAAATSSGSDVVTATPAASPSSASSTPIVTTGSSPAWSLGSLLSPSSSSPAFSFANTIGSLLSTASLAIQDIANATEATPSSPSSPSSASSSPSSPSASSSPSSPSSSSSSSVVRAASVTVTAVPDCSYTYVNGRAGTGYEGATCSTDINECLRGTDGCSENAGCINTVGSYTCECFAGYSGDGFTCRETSELASIQANYTSDGSGYLACDQGYDVAYPEGAPGFAYNPFNTSRFGSQTTVSLLGCMQACAVADACDSFAYSETQQSCFLKSNPSKNTCTTVCAASDASDSCGQWTTYYGPGRDDLATSTNTVSQTPDAAPPPPPPPAVTSASPYAPGSAAFDFWNTVLGGPTGRRRRRLARALA